MSEIYDNPFKSFAARPSYGQRICELSFEMQEDVTHGMILFYRSPDGITEWKCLNADNPTPVPADGSGKITDTELPARSRFREVYYRAVLELPGDSGEMQTPIITVGRFEDLPEREYRFLQRAWKRELTSIIHHRQGFRAFLLRELSDSQVKLPYADPVSGAEYGIPCDDEFLTKYYDNGWSPPIEIWVKPLSVGEMKFDDIESGAGHSENQAQQFRMPGIPVPRQGDVIVEPDQDWRWAIGNTIQPYRLRGIYPIAYEVISSLLHREDFRYKLPIPGQPGWSL